ncbi:RHS repeat domain-containing protein [Pseudoxanthomonas sp. USHLN014]|uniref:RHS repeat domain-containing protein n=1 Tax=Pseudoxanthomonas sp. USHLN014 TaxID=3081297 RepID=UPI00301C6EEE
MRAKWNDSLWLSYKEVLSTILLPCLMLVPVASLSAQSVTLPEEFNKLVTATSQVKGLNTGLAGDEVNLYSGSLGLTQTDISVPGNNALAVEVTRRLSAGQGTDGFHGFFGDWDLSIPSIHGVFPLGSDWAFGSGEIRKTRCSNYEAPPDAVGQQGGDFAAGEYWQGTFVYLPGKGDQELLSNPAAVPTDGRSYGLTLADGSAVTCVANLASGSSPSIGEGFEVVTRDGTRYRFDHMTTRSHTALKKSSAAPQVASASRSTIITPQAYNGYILYRNEYVIYPTQVTDRFGNTVTYNWNPSNANQLQSITSSDGRSIAFTYVDASGYQIKTASSAGRTWTYSYATSISLGQVTLPDQSSWKFNLESLVSRTPGQHGSCDTTTGGGTSTGTVTHPSGAVITFGLQAVRMSRTWVPRECLSVDGISTDQFYAYYPKESYAMALVSKSITGPGLPSAGYSWTYAYDETAGCWIPSSVPSNATAAPKCTASTPALRTTTVTKPDGSIDKLMYGNRFRVNEGQLLSQQSALSGGAALRTETRTYAAPDAGPYPAYIGYSIQPRGDGNYASQYHPLNGRLIQQEGTSFSWTTTFDSFARQLEVTRTGPSGTVKEKRSYKDVPSLWIMDQVASVTNSDTGVVMSAGEYTASGVLVKAYAFGQLAGTYAYNADGTLSSATDAVGHATNFSNWKRGIAQSVVHADGNSQSAVVSDAGWITSRTDELGNRYSYGYDAMGRLASLNYPNDNQVWSSTTQVFEPVASDEYGLGAGHWRQVVSQGNNRKLTYYDGLWRPTLVREFDAANEAGTVRFQRFAYDAEGRQTFASYPSSSSGTTSGVWKSYDALGRLTSSSQDSEGGTLTTLTEYLTGNKTRTTDPLGHKVVTSFQAFDTPNYETPTVIDAQEGAKTTIARDVFGKPMSISRTKSGG